MKKFILFFSLIVFAVAPKAYGWARLGHAVVARVAEDHLSPKAKKALAEYLGGDVTAQDFPVKMRPILFSQLRNAGYRLAALLNDIFG